MTSTLGNFLFITSQAYYLQSVLKEILGLKTGRIHVHKVQMARPKVYRVNHISHRPVKSGIKSN